MEGNNIFKQLIRDFHTRSVMKVKPRDYSVPLNTGKIITLIGARRSGKTYLLYQIIEQVLQNIPQEKIIFINFEDERLDLQASELNSLLQAVMELYPEHNDLSEYYFFFDEIQNISGWEKFVRRLYDQYSKNIYVTGSNSKLLSSEIATALRGRSLSYTVYPLSFKEYLSFKSIPAELYATHGHARVRHALEQYLTQGSFPEIVLLDDALVQRQILQEYYQVMVFRDLIERYQIRNTQALKFFLKRLSASHSKQVSVNRLYNDLKSAGISVGKTSLYEFMEAAEAIFFAGILKKYSQKVSTRELGERKIYLIDNGLFNAIHFQTQADQGKGLEQIVYWELRRRHPVYTSISYYRDKTECDFIVQEDGKTQAIQVCFDMQDTKTRKREIIGLINACNYFSISEGLIITWDQQEDFTQQGVNIHIVSIDVYLLG
jgi:predicted AAA+ superfamily ATPase